MLECKAGQTRAASGHSPTDHLSKERQDNGSFKCNNLAAYWSCLEVRRGLVIGSTSEGPTTITTAALTSPDSGDYRPRDPHRRPPSVKMTIMLQCYFFASQSDPTKPVSPQAAQLAIFFKTLNVISSFWRTWLMTRLFYFDGKVRKERKRGWNKCRPILVQGLRCDFLNK